MMRPNPKSPGRSEPPDDVVFCELSLYVAGTSSRSLRTIRNVKRVCERQFPGRYKLRIVDIYQQPEEAAAGQIVAVPTLVRNQPEPKRIFIGDMAREADVSGRLRLEEGGDFE